MRAGRPSSCRKPATTTLPSETTSSPAETEEAGRRVGERLRRGDVVLLTGALGAGKTTFVRGVAHGTGSESPVASPTFQLVRVYPGRLQLAHIDLYRVESNSELRDLGLGLPIGLRVPLIPLPTLELQAARSDEPVTAVADAGRGRFYYQVPGGEPALGEASDIPTTYPVVGRVANREAVLIAAGHRFKPEKELRRLVEAAARMLETASEVPYGSLEISYMQSLSPKA